MRRALLVLVAIALVGVPMPVARAACSCDGENPRDALDRTDGAFIGVALSRTEIPPAGPGPNERITKADWRFRVEETFKGRLDDEVVVRSDAQDDRMCGLAVEIGEHVGLFVERIDGLLWTSNCQKVEPDVLRRAGEPLPSPKGRGVPVFFANTRGDHDLVTLDRTGSVLRYADTKKQEHVIFDVCPAGAWAAEIHTAWDPKRMLVAKTLGRRELATMRLSDVGHLGGLERDDEEQRYVQDVKCRDTESMDVLVLARQQDQQGPDQLLRVHDGRTDILAEAPIGGIAVSPLRPIVYIATGDRDAGYALDALDLTTQERRRVTSLDGGVSSLGLDAGGARLIAVEHSVEGPKVMLTVVDVADGSTRRGRHPRSYPIWVGDRIAAPHASGRGLHIYDDRLHLVASKRSWRGPAVAVGGRIYGAWGGIVRSTHAGPGPIRAVADVGLTLEPIDAAPVVTFDRGLHPTWALLGVLLFLVALAVIVIRSRRTPVVDPRPSGRADRT